MDLKRKIFIASNWKMNFGPKETEEFFLALRESYSPLKRDILSPIQLLFFPPFISLEAAQKAKPGFTPAIQIGAQNAHWEKKGAFTGEISGPMLKELGIQWILLGHSERRKFFHEEDFIIQKKLESLILQGFQVILCVGENLEEKEKKQTREVLSQQLENNLPFLEQLKTQLILAYEPVWAIGTGKAALPEEVQEVHQFLRSQLKKKKLNSLPILYGGSVNHENISFLLDCPDVDGVLIGSASWKVQSLIQILLQVEGMTSKF